jgi:hypothetical protein
MIITNTNFAGRIVGATFAAAVLIGAPMAAMTIAPTATAHADSDDGIPTFGDLCPNGLPGDCDADGFSDADERANGLDPLTPNKLDLGDDWGNKPIDKFFKIFGI